MRSGGVVTSYATSPQRQLPCVTPAATATGGRGVEGMPNSGGYSSCCGRSSVMGYQPAFEPTNMCLVGRMPGSPSRLPAGAITMPMPGSSMGATEPQMRQNSRWPRSDDL